MRTIGASQIATILGADPYSTPAELYERLLSGEGVPENEHMTRGKLLEDGLCNWWVHLIKASEVRKQVALVHPNGWARATPDVVARVDGALVIGETKCPAGWRAWDDRTGKYPYHYHLQVIWQLGVAQACGLDVVRGELAAGPIYGKLLRFNITPDPELFALALARAHEFLQCVEGRLPLPETFNPKQEEAA